MKYSRPSKLPFISNEFGFAVDWLRDLIYFCQSSRILEYDSKIENTTQLYQASTGCYDLAIDPYTR